MKITYPAENVVLHGAGEAQRAAGTLSVYDKAHDLAASGTAGASRDGRLCIKVTVQAEVWRTIEIAAQKKGAADAPVFVPAVCDAGYHSAEVCLERGRNTLTARDRVTGETVSQDVFYAPDAYMKYRFSLDDNIWCLQDLAKNAGVYRSVFENPYLSLLRRMHEKYGTKFHLNIYRWCPEHGGFELSDMPDCYKPEFRANADWLRFSFHADSNLPDRPYLFGTYERFYRECGWVNEQIVRFAGEEAFGQTVTTIHWGDATKEVVQAARDLGIRVLIGSGKEADPLNVTISYHLDARQCALLNQYGMIYDEATDMFFLRYGASVQKAKLENIEADTCLWEKQHPLYRFRELCVHEQYFYPDYENYMPDYPERFDTVLRSVTDHGYKPAFVSEIGIY